MTDEWRARARALCDELTARGKLHSPAVEAAVLDVPRHVFVPQFYERDNDGWKPMTSDDPTWWEQVWANRSLVTQLGELRDGSRASTGPTSSSSAPSLMTRMLDALDLRPGCRVLEIGTGTGFNAALLSHVVGDGNVYSIDVDELLVEVAREHLNEAGYQPTLATADGVDGFAEHAPYDRIEATCAVSRVPWAWAEQTSKGGLVLADVKAHAAVGNLVTLRREPDRLEGRFDTGTATFMHMRTPKFERDPGPRVSRDHTAATVSQSTCDRDRLWEEPTLWFLLHLVEQSRIEFGFAMDPDTGQIGNVYYTGRDGSWCELSPPDADGSRVTWQGGPRRLWSTIQPVIDFWEKADAPSWERFGLTVTPHEQTVWLDDPEGPNTWTLVS